MVHHEAHFQTVFIELFFGGPDASIIDKQMNGRVAVEQGLGQLPRLVYAAEIAHDQINVCLGQGAVDFLNGRFPPHFIPTDQHYQRLLLRQRFHNRSANARIAACHHTNPIVHQFFSRVAYGRLN